MILQRQSLQILKIIAGHFIDQDKQQFLFVAKDKLFLVNNNLDELKSININNIIDAIVIKTPNSVDKVAVLTKSNQIQIYDYNLAHLLTFEIHDVSQPHKLIQIENTLFIINFINNCTEIQDFMYPNRQFINHKIAAHIHNIFHRGNYIFYTVLYKEKYSIYSLNQVLLKQFNIDHHCCKAVENVSLGIYIIYSLNKFYIYQINSEQYIFHIQIPEQILDISPILNNNYLMVTSNGSFYQIDYKNDTSINFKKIVEPIQFQEIQYFCFTPDSICLVDENGITILNKQYQIIKKQKLYTKMTKLAVINNKLYASKHLSNSTELYQVNQVQEIRLNKQSDFLLQPDEQVNSIIQRNRKLIIFTNQRLVVKEKNQQISYKLNDPQDYIQVNDELYVLAESNMLQLLKITSKIEQLSQLNQSAPILLLRSNISNNFYGYNSNGSIHQYKLKGNQIELQIEIVTNLFDMTEFIVIDQLLIYGTFSNELHVYNLQSQSVIKTIILDQPVKQLIHNSEQILLGCLFGDIIIYDLQSFSLLNKYSINEQEIDLNYIQVQNNKILVNCKYQKKINRNYLIQLNTISELIIPQKELTNQQYPYFNQNNIQILNENRLNICELKQKILEFQSENCQTIFDTHVVYASDNIIITKTAINIIERSSKLILKSSLNITQYPQFTSADYRHNQLLCAFQSKLILYSVKWDNKIQVLQEVQLVKTCFAVKLSQDLMIVGQGNYIEIYQKQKDKKLFQFQVISMNQIEIKYIFIEEFITQIADKTIVIDIATNKCMIAEFHLKYSHEQDQIELMKITKEFHSPINLNNLTDAQIHKNDWIVFNKLQVYDIYQKVQWAEGGYLKPLNQKNLIQDIVVDSIYYQNKIYFLGICGALWSKNCDDEQYL